MCGTASLHCEVLLVSVQLSCSSSAERRVSVRVKVKSLLAASGAEVRRFHGDPTRARTVRVRARWGGSGQVGVRSGGFDVAAAEAAPVLSSTARWKNIPEPTMEAWTHRQRIGSVHSVRTTIHKQYIQDYSWWVQSVIALLKGHYVFFSGKGKKKKKSYMYDYIKQTHNVNNIN